MIKYALLLLNLLGVLLYQAFFTEGVSVSQKVPSKINSGESFILEMTINKGSVNGFARMKQELPQGFTAVAVDVKGGDFTFLEQDHAVKITWSAMPSDSIFTISYQVISGAAAGQFQIGGVFSYLEGNVKQNIEAPMSDLEVGEAGAATTEPATAAVTEQTTATPITEPAPTEKSAAITTEPITEKIETTTASVGVEVVGSRNIPSTIIAGDEFLVEVMIKKSSLKGFARFQDALPLGCTAMEGNSKGGTFSFMEQGAKILWDNMPEDEELKISYRVKVDESFSGNIIIDGLFSYIENDEPKKYIIPSSIISVTNLPMAAQNSSANKSKQETTAPTPVSTIAKQATNESVATQKPEQLQAGVPSPNATISYKVQIAAGHVQVQNSYFSGKYGIGQSVNTEMHEGWVKYVVGNFDVYKAARDHRQSVKAKGVQGAFVVAYNTGKRITVQEALMITNQQWYR